MAPLFLGLDVGTQGVKAVVYDAASRRIVGRGAQAYGLIDSPVPGRAEQHPDTWVAGALAAARGALAGFDASSVRGVGVSGQQHGMVVLDGEDRVLRPAKLWCDTESAPEAAELSAQLGYTLVPSITSTKLLWLRRHEPDVWARVAAVLLPHDYINLWLTGRKATEAGDASGTGLMDIAARRWDPALAAMIDEQLLGWLPPILGPDEARQRQRRRGRRGRRGAAPRSGCPRLALTARAAARAQAVGVVRPEVAAQLGLGGDVLVSPGSGDNAMAALGAGISQPGQLVVSLGTSATLFGVAGAPIVDPAGAVCGFCDATGAWLPLICTLNCTRPAEDVLAAFGIDHAAATALAAAEPPGCEGVSFLPYLVGERTPNWPDSTGALLGLRPGLLRPGLLYRAALEGATLSLAAALGAATRLGLVPTELRLVGGGSKNGLWRQIVADVFQLPVRVPLEAESAALGAALQAAAVASGVPVGEFIAENQPPMADEVVQPNPAHNEAYAASLARHVSRGEALFGGGAAAARGAAQ
ncbi:xylB [Scenedesmus sp. PABB004]|nr:xylB [Scenedesmus sp. PABB004]